MARIVDWPASSIGFRRDTRSLDEQLRAIAELGSIAPEALLLSEIRMLCTAYLETRSANVSPRARDQGDERIGARPPILSTA